MSKEKEVWSGSLVHLPEWDIPESSAKTLREGELSPSERLAIEKEIRAKNRRENRKKKKEERRWRRKKKKRDRDGAKGK